jgi:aspartate aminotransferase-like enzyme
MEKLEKLKLFITGPTYISERVKQAALLPEFGHRDGENKKRILPIIENLRKIANAENYSIALIPGSGSNAMESSIRSLVKDDEKVLNVSVGAFGDLYHEITKANGKKAELLKFPAGSNIDVNIFKEKIKAFNPDVITITHNETSTGVINDIEVLSNIAKESGALVLVDGVSIFGGALVNLAKWNIDVYSNSTQKSLGTDSGFGIIFVSQDAKSKINSVNNRGYTTDLALHIKSAEKAEILTTPNCSLVNQLYVQLDYIVHQEGIENRYARHKEMMNYTHDWIKSLPEGFALLPDKKFASPTVTAIVVPKVFTLDMLKQIKTELKKKGYLMDTGYGKLNKELADKGHQLTIRIGHMGDITLDMLKTYLDDLKYELIKLGGF